MRTPTTRIDARFSDPDTEATTWDAARDILEEAQLCWITTVRSDGRPHTTPLVAVWLDDMMHVATGPEEQKAINLRNNPHVIVMTGANDWQQGLDVVVEGEAIQVTDNAQLTRLAVAWTTKWNGDWDFEVGDGTFKGSDGSPVLVYAVKPSKVLAFGKGTFTHTSHRF